MSELIVDEPTARALLWPEEGTPGAEDNAAGEDFLAAG
jgi:hypothetical protein